MRKFASSIGLALGLLSAFPAAAMSPIERMDSLTNTTDRFIAGELDARLEELGTDKLTGEKVPLWKQVYIASTKLHCARTLDARKGFNEKCGARLSIQRLLDL